MSRPIQHYRTQLVGHGPDPEIWATGKFLGTNAYSDLRIGKCLGTNAYSDLRIGLCPSSSSSSLPFPTRWGQRPEFLISRMFCPVHPPG